MPPPPDVPSREQHLEPLINETPFLLTRCSRDLRYLFVSRAYASMLGRTAGDIEGRSIAEVMGEDGLSTIRPHVDRVLQGERVEYESAVTFAGVGPRWLRVIYTPDRAADGTVSGWIASIVDITDQRSAREAQAVAASIVHSSINAILTKDLSGIITSWNPAAQQLFGYSESEVIGRPVRLLIPPERQSEEDDILSRLRAGERIEHFETERIARDGRTLALSVTMSPLRNASGVIVGASNIARDISAAKAAEVERVRLLEENASVAETLNDVGSMLASDLNLDKVVQTVTDAATELTTAEFGAFFYNVVNESGKSYTLYTISGVPREAFSKFPMPRNTRVFEPTFTGSAIVRSDDVTKDPRYGHNAPYQGMPPGHLPVRSYLAVPVKLRSGDVIGGLFFGHSSVGRFTENHERLAAGIASWAGLALENARMYSKVDEANRLKDDFLASLSHELRTPLNAILGYTRMLRARILGPDKRESALETIERNATSLTQIVEDLLDVSRIMSGKIHLRLQPVDLAAVLRNIIETAEPNADSKGVTIDVKIDPRAGPVGGDPERLQQVFWNLLSNAVKFTGPGGRVQVTLERVASDIVVSVSDTGIGIAPEFLPHVFERFRQEDTGFAREHGGLGLGLSISRQLTEIHKGSIEAASLGIGHGSTFRVTIPAMKAAPVDTDQHAAGDVNPIAPFADLTGLTVLAVDDDADALALLGELLAAAGAKAERASSASEALASLDQRVPDVLVTDIGMPQVDGLELIERVRRHDNPIVRRLPAIALTAYARSEDRVKALDAGFQVHLAKPIDPSEFVKIVAGLTRRAEPSGKKARAEASAS